MKATVNGIATYYEIHGKEGAPWLTFSHSLACSVRMWDGQIAAFKDRYRILVYDTRGHGGSAAPAGAYTLELLAEDLFELLKKLQIARTHFVGLSMGGMIGQIVALKERALFERLVLEINQAGLSWLTILKKREAFREAFRGFDIDRTG